MNDNVDKSKFSKLFDRCPTNSSKMLLEMIIDLNIIDLDTLRHISNNDFAVHNLVEIAFDDLVKYKVIKIVPSFKIDVNQEWKIYNEIILNKE